MAPKQRQIKIEARGLLAELQALEQRSDEELERETKFKAAAFAILGARAAERFDAERARALFEQAIAAARPQERMMIRRMRDASLALAERRPDQLKEAVERLGQEPPSRRQMLALRVMGLLLPPSSAGLLARLRGVALIILLLAALVGLGVGVVELFAIPAGGIGLPSAVLFGVVFVIVLLSVLAAVGRRRQRKAEAQRAA